MSYGLVPVDHRVGGHRRVPGAIACDTDPFLTPMQFPTTPVHEAHR